MKVKATVTSKGQVTIPIQVRKRLNIIAGQELEFDSNAPFLKATKVVNEKAMRSVVGMLKNEIKESIPKILQDLRGKVDMP